MSRDLGEEPPLPAAFWDALRREEPDPRDVERAYLRFATPRRAPALHLGLSRWLLAGFAVGWGVVFAATGDPLFGAGLRARARAVVPAPPAVVATSAPVAAPRSPDVPPAVAAEQARPEPPARRLEPAAAPGAEGASRDPKWQRVARALRAHDYADAQSALLELEAAGAVADREAASLALAQVLVTRGQLAGARARLERLRKAASPVVRDKAARLLSELSSPPGRSDPPGAATQ